MVLVSMMARGQCLGLFCGKNQHYLLTRLDGECGRKTSGRDDVRCFSPQQLEGGCCRERRRLCVGRFVEGAGQSAPGLGGVGRFTEFSLVMLHFPKGPKSRSQQRVHLPGFGQENTGHSRQLVIQGIRIHHYHWEGWQSWRAWCFSSFCPSCLLLVNFNCLPPWVVAGRGFGRSSSAVSVMRRRRQRWGLRCRVNNGQSSATARQSVWAGGTSLSFVSIETAFEWACLGGKHSWEEKGQSPGQLWKERAICGVRRKSREHEWEISSCQLSKGRALGSNVWIEKCRGHW